MFIAAAADNLGIKFNLFYRLDDCFAVQIFNFNGILADNGQFAVIQVNNVADFADNGRNVAGDIVLVFAQTDNQRCVFRTAIILSGSSWCIMQKANAPSRRLTPAITASSNE